MTQPLPAAFLDAPIAHRALHDATRGRPENSRAAVMAAVAAGYGIEIDVQPSSDGEAMVFHDHDLGRMTRATGPIDGQTAQTLAQIHLCGTHEGIPTLSDILERIAGRVALLIEIKDQDGGMGPNIGPLERAVAAALRGYDGPAAVMSFNPHSAALAAHLMPERAVGLVTCAFRAADWPMLPAETRERLAAIPDAGHVGFISHNARYLDTPRIAQIKAEGLPVLCWTVRSPKAEARARRIADNITFEGYLANRPGA
jgi:glycerophosphoryl diester phosphodiesterase